MNRNQAKDMLRLAAFLRNVVPVKSWDFSGWFQIGTKSPQEAIAQGGGCGTTACALGWAPAVFPKKLAWNYVFTTSSDPTEDVDACPLVPDTGGDILLLDDKGKATKNDHGYFITDFEAGKKFFGLNEEQATLCFVPLECEDRGCDASHFDEDDDYSDAEYDGQLHQFATKEEVAEQIERVVADAYPGLELTTIEQQRLEKLGNEYKSVTTVKVPGPFGRRKK